MAQPEFAVLADVTAAVLQQLTRLWVTLWGSIRVLPSEVQTPTSAPQITGRHRGRAAGVPAGEGSGLIDFPQVWTDAVDNGVQEIIEDRKSVV